jgi:hypothetical protein
MAAPKKPRPVLHVAGTKSLGDQQKPTGAAAKTAAAVVVDRTAMVAMAAYYRAERRNFCPGGELEDWLEAEREVDAQLTAASTRSASAG